jgi:predicted metallo-beta-lactamase superfamily hydrolase
VRLHIREDEYVLRVKDDDVELTFADHKAFFSSFKRTLLNNMVSLWHQKEWQGRVARTENVDKKNCPVPTLRI